MSEEPLAGGGGGGIDVSVSGLRFQSRNVICAPAITENAIPGCSVLQG